jgi:hypothetical protein
MGLFSTILDKLGLSKPKPATPVAPAAAPVAPPAATVVKPVAAPVAPVAATAVKPVAAPVATTVGSPTIAPAAPPIPPVAAPVATTTSPAPPVAAPPAPQAISEVDVVKKLEQIGKGSGLDWKVSIVDLLKLLDIDSSREARNELAKELSCPAELMSDSAKMNTWLHKTVLRKIAENGGNIPKELLD